MELQSIQESQLQTDGKHILSLNRDDQAGFRLDSSFTHKNFTSLNSFGQCLTMHTGFLNKYPAHIQTASYNFTKTTTNSEFCVGVVKASGMHQKNPAQHLADLEYLQSLDTLQPVFAKNSREPKDVECIRVDGVSDEGPSHAEVQFLWTERHMTRPTKVALVTRASGDSLLSIVELQNGCLSIGHSNLFIPSTLCGEPYDEKGKFSETKHCDNMDTAVQQYINRVNGTPCMGTSIDLHRGGTEHCMIDRRSRLLVFLKGSAKDKAELKNKYPEEYSHFQKVCTWSACHQTTYCSSVDADTAVVLIPSVKQIMERQKCQIFLKGKSIKIFSVFVGNQRTFVVSRYAAISVESGTIANALR